MAIDRIGNVVIIELKRDKTPRDVVAQILDYAAWINELDPERIYEIARNYLGKELDEAFKEIFGYDLPEITQFQKMLIVAIEPDDNTERIVKYLSEKYGVDINVVRFEFFKDDEGNQFLLRTFALDPSEVERTATEGRIRRKINKTEFLAACNDIEKEVFERIFEMAEKLNLNFSWGTTGCSIRVPTNEGDVIFCYCYSPIAYFGSSISICKTMKFKGDEIAISSELAEKFRSSNLFKESKEYFTFYFSRTLTEEEIGKLMELFENVIEEIKRREEEHV